MTSGADRRYRRAVRRAFYRVTFYREQWARAGAVLTEPEPTGVESLPDPPHTLCPYAKPWSSAREPSLWTPGPGPLAEALRIAGCADGAPVLEVRDALLDGVRLPRPVWWRRRPAYAVLLSKRAVVASPEHREALDAGALAAAGGGWVVGEPDDLDAVPQTGGLRPVHRLALRAAVEAPPGTPLVLYEWPLGYVGARDAHCGQLHLGGRIHARRRDGRLALSIPAQRRPTLLDMVVPGSDALAVDRCPAHRTPVVTLWQPGSPG